MPLYHTFSPNIYLQINIFPISFLTDNWHPLLLCLSDSDTKHKKKVGWANTFCSFYPGTWLVLENAQVTENNRPGEKVSHLKLFFIMKNQNEFSGNRFRCLVERADLKETKAKARGGYSVQVT